MKENTYDLPAGVVKACAGLLEIKDPPEHVKRAIEAAEAVVGTDYYHSHAAQQNRQNLIRAVKLNLANRKKHPREYLNRRFGLHLSKDALAQERRKFCYELAIQMGYIKKPG